jgi:hypothetical protein
MWSDLFFSIYISLDLLDSVLDSFVHRYTITNAHNNNRVHITCSNIVCVRECWCIWFVCAITCVSILMIFIKYKYTHAQIHVRTQICQSTCTNTTFYISVVTTLWELRFKFYRLVHGDFSSTNLARHHFGLTHLAQTATMAGQILLNGLPGAFLSAGWPGPSQSDELFVGIIIPNMVGNEWKWMNIVVVPCCSEKMSSKPY